MATKSSKFESPFDTYTIVRSIGEGGSGRVYEVKNASGEVFALKSLAPERITTEKLKRFKNEVAFCQKSSHPNIVKVLDTGSTESNGVKCPFYVMQCFEGTLRSQIGKLQPDESLRVFAQILDGVEAAHLTGVWHRDLKPENILWSQRDRRPVVGDFGIAHFEEEEIYTAVETKHAARMANFLYSSPEQRVRGTAIDRRADIFALGLILNELFTGKVPQGEGYQRIGDVAPDYAYLDDIVGAMIQHDPGRRPASIEEIKKELIGRKNAFVALQQLDAAKNTVIKSAEVPEFEPIKIIGVDIEGGVLKLKLNRNIPAGWAQEFHQPRGGHQFVMGYGPESFSIRGSEASISIRGNNSTVQQVVDFAKTYVEAANRGYVQQQRELAARLEHEQRQKLEQQVREAELRKSLLASIRL